MSLYSPVGHASVTLRHDRPFSTEAVWKRARAKNAQHCFLIVFPRQRSSVLLVCRLTKSRRTFYAQIQARGFHTASGNFTRSWILRGVGEALRADLRAGRVSPLRPETDVSDHQNRTAARCALKISGAR